VLSRALREILHEQEQVQRIGWAGICPSSVSSLTT
jgi:hypothetical protein